MLQLLRCRSCRRIYSCSFPVLADRTTKAPKSKQDCLPNHRNLRMSLVRKCRHPKQFPGRWCPIDHTNKACCEGRGFAIFHSSNQSCRISSGSFCAATSCGHAAPEFPCRDRIAGPSAAVTILIRRASSATGDRTWCCRISTSDTEISCLTRMHLSRSAQQALRASVIHKIRFCRSPSRPCRSWARSAAATCARIHCASCSTQNSSRSWFHTAGDTDETCGSASDLCGSAFDSGGTAFSLRHTPITPCRGWIANPSAAVAVGIR